MILRRNSLGKLHFLKAYDIISGMKKIIYGLSIFAFSLLMLIEPVIASSLQFDRNFIYALLITLVPGVELRGSIPLVLLVYKQGLWSVVIITVLNIIITPLVFIFWYLFLKISEHVGFLKRFTNFYLKNLQKRSQKTINKFGFLGLLIFVAIPLPGTGAYSGALIAEIFGMNKIKAFISITIGIIIASLIVTLAILGIIPLKII